MECSTIFTISERIHVMKSPFIKDKLAETRSYIGGKMLNKVKIYNLEDEDEFNIDQDLPNVVSFPTLGGCPTALETIIDICSNADSFLTADSQNHVIFHCKNGKQLIAPCMLSRELNISFLIRKIEKLPACSIIAHPPRAKKHSI